MKRQTKVAENKKEEPDKESSDLISKLIPLIRKHYDIEIEESFKFKGKSLKISKENDTEKIVDDTGLEFDFEKNKDIFYAIFSGDEKSFERGEFIPKEGQEYWTFNIPENLNIIKRIYGQNQIADLISTKFKIVYKSQKEIQRIDTDEIIKKMT